MSGSGTTGRVRALDVLRDREVAGLVVAQVLSEWGDQVTRVALAVVLLRAYDSPLLAALVFAVGLLPGLVGSALLGPVADRVPRRAVLLGCDLARAGVVACLALLTGARAPVAVLLLVLLLAELVGAPFVAARGALLGDVLPDPARYFAAEGLMRVLNQADQALGFLLGGAAIALLGARGGLLLDAASFLVSAALVLALVRARPAAATGSVPGLRGFLTDLAEGGRLVLADRRHRAVLAVGWGSTVFMLAPEGTALAYARAHGQGAVAGGLLLAAIPTGAALGAAWVARRAPTAQVGLVLPLAVTGAALLLPMAVDPPVPVAAVLWLLSGACQGFMLTLIATLVLLTPPAARGRVGGLAGSGFAAASTCSLALAGWLAQATTPAFAVTLAGVLGLALLGLASRTWPEASLRRGVTAATADPATPAVAAEPTGAEHLVPEDRVTLPEPRAAAVVPARETA